MVLHFIRTDRLSLFSTPLKSRRTVSLRSIQKFLVDLIVSQYPAAQNIYFAKDFTIQNFACFDETENMEISVLKRGTKKIVMLLLIISEQKVNKISFRRQKIDIPIISRTLHRAHCT